MKHYDLLNPQVTFSEIPRLTDFDRSGDRTNEWPIYEYALHIIRLLNPLFTKIWRKELDGNYETAYVRHDCDAASLLFLRLKSFL